MNKILFLLTTTLFLIPFSGNAQKKQNKEKRKEIIRTLKIAFITDKLDLTSSEAEKFWPVYNKFDKELHQLEREEKSKLKEKIKAAGGVNNLSEKEAISILQNFTDVESQIHKTKTAYDAALIKILSPKKILTLKITERTFIRNLMKKYRRKKMK